MISTDEAHRTHSPSVFVTSHTSADLGVVLKALEAENLQRIEPSSNPKAGLSLSLAIQTAIRACSFVLIIVTDDQLPAAVLFEVGVATALGRPVAILDTRRNATAVDRTEFALSALVEAPILNAELTDETVLRRELRNYILGVLPLHPSASKPLPTTQEARRPSSARVGDEAEDRCARALQNFGFRTSLHQGGTRGTPDLIASLSELGPVFDPLLVEVVGLRGRLAVKREQLTKSMLAASAHLGLLVALDDVALTFDRTSPTTMVITLGLRFLENATREEFLDWLTHARNRLVHG